MVAAAVVLLVGCHTITEETPTEPTEVANEPKPTMAAITIPVILPASNPTPSPAATPGGPAPTPGTSPPPIPGTTIPVPGTSPTPTPEPPSTPPPSGGGSCSLPPGDPNASCSRTGETFLGDVEEAIDRVVDRNPGLFDRDDKVCNNCYRILDHDRYVEAVSAQMRNMGYCVYYDGEELAVKNTNSFNDQYDISTSRGFIRRGVGAYRTTCWPAWF
jgi:hypothetical protein